MSGGHRLIQSGVLLFLLGLLTGLAPAALSLPRLGVSAHAGWLAPLLGGIWGAGGSMLPIAAGDARGSAFEEAIIASLLVTAALALIAVCVLVLWGLRAGPPREGA